MGIGVSFFTEGVGAGPRKDMDIAGLGMADGAELRVHPTGKAVVRISVKTQGQGHETTFAQIVAEELGIPPEDIEVVHGDTDQTPFGLGTYGSRSTPVSGAAVAMVSRKVRDKARLIAAAALEVSPDDLEWEKGRWFVAGDPSKAPDDPGAGAGLARRARAARGRRGPPRRRGGLQPAEPDVPVRRVHLRRRRRPGDGRGQGAPVRLGRRLRRADQPDDRRGADRGRPGRGARDRAHAAHRLRRGGQLPVRARSWTTSSRRRRRSRTGSWA